MKHKRLTKLADEMRGFISGYAQAEHPEDVSNALGYVLEAWATRKKFDEVCESFDWQETAIQQAQKLLGISEHVAWTLFNPEMEIEWELHNQTHFENCPYCSCDCSSYSKKGTSMKECKFCEGIGTVKDSDCDKCDEGAHTEEHETERNKLNPTGREIATMIDHLLKHGNVAQPVRISDFTSIGQGSVNKPTFEYSCGMLDYEALRIRTDDGAESWCDLELSQYGDYDDLRVGR